MECRKRFAPPLGAVDAERSSRTRAQIGPVVAPGRTPLRVQPPKARDKPRAAWRTMGRPGGARSAPQGSGTGRQAKRTDVNAKRRPSPRSGGNLLLQMRSCDGGRRAGQPREDRNCRVPRTARRNAERTGAADLARSDPAAAPSVRDPRIARASAQDFGPGPNAARSRRAGAPRTVEAVATTILVNYRTAQTRTRRQPSATTRVLRRKRAPSAAGRPASRKSRHQRRLKGMARSAGLEPHQPIR
jgi:hypothetical protein